MCDLPKVLAVDDDQGVATCLEKVLRIRFRGRIAVTAMTDSVAARRWIKEVNPEVIVTDLDMPDVDGFALTCDARQWNPDVQVIIHSGHVDPCVDKLARKLGANECVSKNGDFVGLCAAIERALERLPSARGPAPPSGPIADNMQSWPENQTPTG